MAGLLNILAIYDAYEGPAYQEIDEESHVARAIAVGAGDAGELKAEGSA